MVDLIVFFLPIKKQSFLKNNKSPIINYSMNAGFKTNHWFRVKMEVEI